MLALNELFRKVLRSSRKKVLKFFIECLGPRSDDVILDLGAAGDYCGEQPFFEDNYRWKKNIIGVNVNIDELASLKRKYKEIPLILADGCCLPFKSKSIDILFSNAVIEHVGDLKRQKKFADEIMRVSKKWFVTTPNFWFPIETHWKLPFIHFLPRRVQKQIMGFGKKWFVENPSQFYIKLPRMLQKLFRRYFTGHGFWMEGYHLLNATKLKKLFPTSEIKKQRTTLYPEVLIAHSPAKHEPKKSAHALKIVYANWPEGYINLRFLRALIQKYDVYAFFFDETNRKIFRVQYEPIRIPSGVKIIKVQDPPLLPIPLYVRLATKRGSVAWVVKLFFRVLIFRKCIKKLNPDLLIGNGVSGTNPYGLCSALSSHHPFLVLVWGSDILIEARNSRIFRLVAKYVLKKADGVIVDNAVKTKAAIELGCKKNKIFKFPWGIDLERFNPDVDGLEVKRQLGWENNKIVISTRNHFPIYGIEYLIRAIPIVVRKVPEARFLIMGDGPLTKVLKKMTKKLGIARYAHFTGEVSNQQIPRYLRAADVYVSTSFSDGTSPSLLESLACGLPVVVSDILGNREWIRNGRNGFLVPVKDSKALAEKIIFLLKNHKIRKLVGNSNIELAKAKANWKQNVNLFYDVIETLTR